MQGVSVTRAGRGSPQPAAIEAGRLRLRLDPTALRLDLSDAQGGLGLLRFAPHVEAHALPDTCAPGGLDAGAVGPGCWLAIGEVKAAAGPALRLEVQAPLAGGLGLRWTLEVSAAGTGVAAALALENRGAGPVRVHTLAPLSLASLPEGLALASVAPHAGSLPVGVLRGPATWLAVGFTTALRGDGRIELAEGPQRGFRLESLTQPVTLSPGESLESERAWLGVGADDTALLVEWVRRAAAEMDACVPSEPDGAPSDPHGAGWTRTAAASRSGLADAGARAGRDAHIAWTTKSPTLSGVGVVGALALPPAPGPDWLSRALDLAFTGRRLWLLDPGAALQPRTATPTEAERTQLCVRTLLGGVPSVDADPVRLDPERARWLQLATPPLGRGSHARRVAGGRALVTPLPGGRTIVLLVNESSDTTLIGVSFAELGLAGRHHVFDFWAGQDRGVRDDGVPASSLCAGGSRLLALTPVADRPIVVGTTLHLGMGSLEVSALRTDAAGVLSLALRLPGRRRGAVWIAVPGEPVPRRVEVAFDGALTVTLPAPGARNGSTER